MQGGIHRCWALLRSLVLLALVLALVGGYYFYNRLDEEVRRQAETLLSRHYHELKVTVRAARWISGEGIEIRGVTIQEPTATAGDSPRELLHIDELFIEGTAELKDLVSGELRITRIILRRPTLYLTRRADASWSVNRLLPLPSLGGSPPQAVVEDGRVIVRDPLKNSRGMELRQVNLALEPRRVEITPAEPSGRPEFMIQGQFVGEHVRRAELNGVVSLDGERLQLAGRVGGVSVCEGLLAGIPALDTPQVQELACLQAVADFDFQLSLDPHRPEALQFSAEGQLNGGHLAHPQLPFPLTDLRARVHVSNQGVEIHDLTARNGQTQFWGRILCRGLTPESPMSVDIKGQQVILDRRLVDKLEPKWKDQWNRFMPAGEVDLDMHLEFDGQEWVPSGTVHCRNVAFTYHKFPYRLERGAGVIRINPRRLTLELRAFSGMEEIRIDGTLDDPREDAHGKIIVKGQGLQINNKLLTALEPEQRKILQSMNPRGSFDIFVEARLERDDPEPILYTWLRLNRCSIRFDQFPYPVDDVCGTIEVVDKRWAFQELRGVNDRGFITAGGHFDPEIEGGELYMWFEGRDIPLDAELRDSLKPAARQLWSRIRPNGTINLFSEVRYYTKPKDLNVTVKAEPLEDTTSIEPVSFPYRLEKIQGLFVYENGHVQLQDMQAQHGRVQVAARGMCDMQADGHWVLRLEDLRADRVTLSHDLRTALPPQLRRAVEQVDFAGSVNISQSMVELTGHAEREEVDARWNLNLDCHQASLRCGVALDNMHGSVWLQGSNTAGELRSWGRLRLDSVSHKNYQLTQLHGPLWIDNKSVRFGGWVPVPQGQQPEPLQALAYGGVVRADGWVSLEETPQFRLVANLDDGDLRRCAQELWPGSQHVSGRMQGQLDVWGTAAGLHTLNGRGTINLRDADVYELPVMVSMLKILSIRPPDTTAFTKSDIDFQLQGEHVYFQKIDFNGDAVSLLGTGQMDLNRNIGLTFYAMVGRDELKVPIVRDLVGGASQQILLIHVDGTLDEPKPWKEAFPGVNQALQQLQQSTERPLRR